MRRRRSKTQRSGLAHKPKIKKAKKAEAPVVAAAPEAAAPLP